VRNPVRYIRSLPIRQQLSLLMLLSCFVVLLLAGAALLRFQIVQFRKSFESDISSLADILSVNCAAAITLNDSRAATETLNTLKVRKHILGAILTLPDGTVFASYDDHTNAPGIETRKTFSFPENKAGLIAPVLPERMVFGSDGNHTNSLGIEAERPFSFRENETGLIAPALADHTVFASAHTNAPGIETGRHFSFQENEAWLIEPVMFEGKQVATLHLVSDYQAVYTGLIKLVGWMLMIVFVVCAGVAMLLSNWLQRFISNPVLRLAQTVQAVADQNDYSIRVREEAGVELGILTRSFNQMLTRIQKQELAITLSQKRIEAIANSIEGILWQRSPDTLEFTFVSHQCEHLLGYTPEQLMANPHFWRDHLHSEDADKAIQAWFTCIASSGPYNCEYRVLAADEREVWIRESGSVVVEQGQALAMRGIFQDITKQKIAAGELEGLNQSLLQASRLAGRAEVATGVLHNVGNVLNSVSVCATIMSDHLHQSKVMNLLRAAEMIRGKNGDLAEFLTQDPKGKLIPDYLVKAAKHLAIEQSEMISEAGLITQNIEHIKQIVAMQQDHAKVSGAFEHIAPTDLVEDALSMNAATFESHRVNVIREYKTPLPKVNVDRHKVLQILVNLLQNALDALDTETKEERRLVVRLERLDSKKVAIRVIDNGIGIAPEQVSRIFQHGFTTKKNGHGFGLHSSANAAKEIGGCLALQSDGLGLGAEFTLELPAAEDENPVSS